MDQKTGQVKAISGGRGTKTASLTLNRATDTTRQPGSTFKVITAFAPALDTCGATLGSVYYDAPFTIGRKTFKNWYKQGYLGYSSIRDGIIYSMNIVAVRTMMETVSPQLGVEYAKNFGITTLTDTDMNAATGAGRHHKRCDQPGADRGLCFHCQRRPLHQTGILYQNPRPRWKVTY